MAHAASVNILIIKLPECRNILSFLWNAMYVVSASPFSTSNAFFLHPDSAGIPYANNSSLVADVRFFRVNATESAA
jgi:hypothetical protein